VIRECEAPGDDVISASAGEMVKQTATFKTTYEIAEEKTEWIKPQAAELRA